MRIGVDLGGTKIETIALDGAGRERARARIAAPRGDYQTTIRTVAEQVRAVAGEAGAARIRVGVGTPGSSSPVTGLMRNANSTWLNGMPFERDLAAALDDALGAALGAPLRMANDANCFAVSEAADGAGAGAASVFGVIIGTGVGGGLVQAGRLIGGANGVAGEWGHIPLPSPGAGERGLTCWCGRSDCLETWLSGPALAADFARATGREASAVAIADAAAAGEADAVAALDRYIDRLGRALAVIVNVFDPETIVLGGGLSNIERLYRDGPEAMRPHVFADGFTTTLAKNRHGDSSGVRGAAWLWPAEEEAGR